MKRWMRVLVGVVAVVLVLALVGPFLVPVPPLEGTVPPRELADPDSHFVEVNGLTVHYKQAGTGEPVFLLLHGFGASTFSWREVMEPLGELGTVVAYDRPAFGLTERPLPGEFPPGENPYSAAAQVEIAVGLLEALGHDEAIWVGNSAGGTVAVNAALTHPEAVEALVLVDPAIYTGGGTPPLVRPLLKTPQADHLGPLLVRSISSEGEELLDRAWHEPAKLTEEVREGYRRPLRAQHWDRALWELSKAKRADVESRLDELRLPVLVITGDDDRIVPTEESVRLAGELPDAELEVLGSCGHVPQEECPGAFMEAVRAFVTGAP